jgi:UDP-glucose 4-epimerase
MPIQDSPVRNSPLTVLSPEQQKRVVVLGASGFLGSAMASYLAAIGHEVVTYSRRPLQWKTKQPGVTSVIGDLRDTWTLADAIRGADVVYHFASATHPSMFFGNPSAEFWEALQPLMTLVEIAANQRVKKIVFPSSGGTVYASSSDARKEDSLTDPRSPYAIFKLASEHLLFHAARQGSFSVDVFRLGNPFGPGQPCRPGQGVLPHWIDAILKRDPIHVFGDGSAARDYIYVDDVCRLMSISCQRLESSETFNLGTGQATTLRELLELMRSCVPYEIPAEYLPERVSDVQSIALNPSRLLEVVPGFSFTPLSVGLKRLLAHHRLANFPLLNRQPFAWIRDRFA